MGWQDSKSLDDIIDATEFTNMANTLEQVSGSYFGHSSNSTIHYPSSNLRNWMDGVYAPSGVGGDPSAPVNSIQFNEASSFGGDSELSWDTNLKKLTLSGMLKVSGSISSQSISGGLVTAREIYTGDTLRIKAGENIRIYQEPGNEYAVFWGDGEMFGIGLGGGATPTAKLHVKCGTVELAARFESTDDKCAIEIKDNDTEGFISVKDGVTGLGGSSVPGFKTLNIHRSGAVKLGSANFPIYNSPFLFQVSGNISGTSISGGSINIGSTTKITSILDEDTLSSDSDTALATQQSIKAYIDTISSNLDTKIDASSGQTWSGAVGYYELSSNLDGRFSPSSHIHDSDYYPSSTAKTKFESLFNFSSNKGLYYPSSLGKLISGSYYSHSSNKDIHFPSSNLTDWLNNVYALSGTGGSSWSGATDFWNHSSNVDIHFPSSSIREGWLDGVYAPSGTTTAWSGAVGYVELSGSLESRFAPSTNTYDNQYYPSSNGHSLRESYDNHSGNADIHFASSNLENWLNDVYISQNANIDVLGDVDTATDTPARNEVLKWNGTNWVPAEYNYDFTFTFDSFGDNQSSPQLIGSGQWLGVGELIFSATYTNGPPSSMRVYIDGDYDQDCGSGWTDDKLTFTGSAKLSQSNTEITNYPDDANDTVTFRASANSESPRTTTVQFKNTVRWGESNAAGALTSSQVNALDHSDYSDDRTQTFDSVSPAAGEYAILAYPTRLGTLDEATRFRFKRQGTDDTHMTAKFFKQTLSPHTNTSKYHENYYVYKSSTAALGDGEIQTTSTTEINQVRYGWNISGNGGVDQTFIDNLQGAKVTNPEDDDISAASGYDVDPAGTNFAVLAVPSDWNVDPAGTSDRALRYRKDGGLEATMSSQILDTINWKNPCGYIEEYNVFSSSGLKLPNGKIGFGMARLNLMHAGTSTKADSWTSADITGLLISSSTNDETATWGTIEPGANDYVIFACPARRPDLTGGTDYEDDGDQGTEFRFSGLTAAFESKANVTVTNLYGFKEDYDVYRSTEKNIGGGKGTLITLNSPTTTAFIYYGGHTDESAAAWSLSDFDTMANQAEGNKSISDDNTIYFTTNTAGGQFIWFCYPKRLGTVVFYQGVNPGGFEDPETVSLTNANGWSEDYYCYRSENHSLGSVELHTEDS